MDHDGSGADPHQHALQWNADARRAIEDDGRGAVHAGIAREQFLDGLVLVQQRKDRTRGARDNTLVFFFFVHGADV
jgi:hypothetical protein